jgi:ATP-dependent DNA helicase PIF1
MDLLNEEQRRAFDAVIAGRSIFITGPGGTGKSFLLQALYESFKARTGKVMAVTALTGCAALLLGPWAKTLHSWAGIGLGRGAVESVARAISMDARKRKRWRGTNCLVIDEVSMLTPYLLEYLDKVGRIVRKCDRPMGGLQVVFVGDFYQLPPVMKAAEAAGLSDGGAERTFAFESPLWSQIVSETIELRQIVRQKDPSFQRILNEARVGELSPESYAALEARKTMDWKRQEIKPTLIFTKNTDVATINETQLAKLQTAEVKFAAKTTAPPRMPVDIVQMLVEKLDKDAPYEPELTLKERAQVMLLVNQDPEAGLVNGSRGVVTGFSPMDGAPLVKFLHGPPFPVKVMPHEWKSDADNEEDAVVRTQIPLRLAWGLTTHRSQGSTLDSALIDIGPSVFEYGQAYVALSRARSLDSVYVFEIHPRAFRAHPAVKAFYAGEAKKGEALRAQREAARALDPGAASEEPASPTGPADPAGATASALEGVLRQFEYSGSAGPRVIKAGAEEPGAPA